MNVHQQPGNPAATFQEIAEAYLADARQGDRLSDTTLAARRLLLNTFAAAQVDGKSIGATPAIALRPEDLRTWIESNSTWRSSTTRRSKAADINAVLTWAMKVGIIPENPLRSVTYEKAAHYPVMSGADLDKIVAHASEPFARFLNFLRLTGWRVEEARQLRWEDIDPNRGVVTIRRAKHGSRVLVIGQEAMGQLARLREVSPPPGPVFRNSRGTAWDKRSLDRQLRRTKARAGVNGRAGFLGIRYRWCLDNSGRNL